MTIGVTLKLYARQDWGYGVYSVISGAYTFSVTAGSTLVAFYCGWNNTNAIGVPIDSAGTFLQESGTAAFTNYCTQAIALQKNAASGNHTITPYVLESGTSGDAILVVVEVTGLSASPIVRDTNKNYETGTNLSGAFAVSSDSTPQVGDLALAFFTEENNSASPSDVDTLLGVPSGYTEVMKYVGLYYMLPTEVAYKVLDSGGVTSPSWTCSDPNIVDRFATILVLEGSGGVTLSGTLGQFDRCMRLLGWF